jgi:cystathionine beta-lyase/cystathionine gamma-synthase
VPSFDTVEELQHGLALKGERGAPDLYPRDGFSELLETEGRIAGLTRSASDATLLFTSGMAAVATTLATAVAQAEREMPLVACPPGMYSQITAMLAQLHGCKLLYFKPGDPRSVATVLDTEPDVLVVETVGNDPSVPVLDVEHLLAHARGSRTFMLLDNTLPLPTACPLAELLETDDRALVIESGTKSYVANQELCGIVYGVNEDLVDLVRRRRRMNGTMPGVGSVERIASLLPTDRDVFDSRNLAVFEATAALANSLYEAQVDGADFRVFHPALSHHANHDLARTGYAGFGSPVLYLRCDDQFELANQLWSNPIVREHADLGQSFAFGRTRLLPDYAFPAVRVAGGYETNTVALGAALKAAAIGSALE